jgi:DNA-binding NtrC family response regulator
VFELALHFLKRYAAEAGKTIVRIEEEALEALTAYSWPGNIRQLENAIQRGVVLAEGESLRRRDLPPEILMDGKGNEAAAVAAPSPRFRPRRRRAAAAIGTVEPAVVSALDSELQSLERERLVEAIARADGNKAAAARLLGLPRSTFFSKLRKLGLE